MFSRLLLKYWGGGLCRKIFYRPKPIVCKKQDEKESVGIWRGVIVHEIIWGRIGLRVYSAVIVQAVTAYKACNLKSPYNPPP